jgi:hypothetical protein
MLAFVASAEAFNSAPMLRQAPAAGRMLSQVRMAEEAAAKEAATEEEAPAAPPPPPPVEYSESLPFLVKRKALAGYVGDVGFDPLGFSEILPMVRAQPRSRTRTRAGVACISRPSRRPWLAPTPPP